MPRQFFGFFSGALGLDLGLEQAGFDCVGVNEIDKHCCETIRQNRPDLRLYDCDIRELTAERIRMDTGVEAGELDAVVGGPPCQAFSTAGKRRSFDDDRGNLVMHFLNLAIALEPRWIIIENVRGLLSAPLKHRPHSERGAEHSPLRPEELPGGALDRVIKVLEDSGYKPSFKLYDAANFGVPQRRERLILVAGADGSEVPHLVPTHTKDDWVSFREATKGITEHDHLPLRDKQLKYLKKIGPGENWRKLPPKMQEEALGNAYLSSGGRVGFYRRLAWNNPSPTLVTSPTMPATLLAHPEEDRPLSIQEYKRLQGFPDNWKLAGSLLQQYKQLGNAVPVGLAKCLGEHLLLHAEGNATVPVRSDVRTSRYKDTDHTAWHSRRAEIIAEARKALVSV